MIIVPPNQTIKVEIEDATFWVNPLTSQQRQEILNFKRTKSGEPEVDVFEMSKRALKYGLKKAQGLLLPDGSEFKLKYEDGYLCDEHCTLLVDASAAVHTLALKLSQGIAPETGPGIKVSYEAPSKKKSRKG
jgi:hypothetical protein